MNLKDLLSSRDEARELYWSLVIEKGWVQAGIWYIGSSALEIVNISPPAAWNHENELVDACDAALSSAVSNLPENYKEPSKTVFGVVSKWVKGGEIQDEYLAQIKTVCTDLSLTPVGFVVLPEAVAFLYKSEEGTPLSAVVVGLGEDSLEVSVFKMGNLAGTTAVARSVSLTDDVTEGLSRFEGAAPLPSRIIIYDGKGEELEMARDELSQASWDNVSKIKFLHTPKVEILSSDRKVLATSLAGAAEIGDVSSVNSVIPQTKKESQEMPAMPSKEEVENIHEPLEEVNVEELGFMVGQDVSQPTFKEPPINVQAAPPIVHVEKELPGDQAQNQGKLNPQHQKVGVGVKSMFHKFSSKLKIKNTSGISTSKKLAILPILIIALGIIFGIVSYAWFVPTARVTVFVSPKSFQEKVGITFSTDGQFDEPHAIVPGSLISSSANGEKTKSTTGTKLVGEKASGSVQVVNGNGNPIRLATGTILTSAGGLKFVTTSEASVSGQLIPGSPGTATLTVNAADLGAQYNLAKGEVFKVGVFDKSQVAATSQADFSGGSSQQIAAVSADDQKKLEADLKQELSGKIVQDLMGKVDKEQVFVNELAELSKTTETYDHKVGEVADTLKLSLTLKGTGIAANKEKLIKYATDSLKNKIPTGYALRSSQIGFKFSFANKNGNNYIYNMDMDADFLPNVDVKNLAGQIVGKSTGDATNLLSDTAGFSRAEIKLNSVLPPPFRTMPHLIKNIKIEIVPEQ